MQLFLRAASRAFLQDQSLRTKDDVCSDGAVSLIEDLKHGVGDALGRHGGKFVVLRGKREFVVKGCAGDVGSDGCHSHAAFSRFVEKRVAKVSQACFCGGVRGSVRAALLGRKRADVDERSLGFFEASQEVFREQKRGKKV